MEATLLTLGVILILVGLVGQVKAKEIEVGTKNPLVRVILGLLGTAFVSIALGLGTGILPDLLARTPTATQVPPTQTASPSAATDIPAPTFTPVTPEPDAPTDIPTIPSPTEVLTADLVISEFSLNPSTPTQGSAVSVRVGISNQGNGSADRFTVQWWAGESDPEPACTWPVDGLSAGAEQTLTCTSDGYPGWYGSLTTLAVIDADENISESDEQNNIDGMTISVEQPQLTSTRIVFDTFPDDSPVTGDQILHGDEFLSQGIRLAGAPEGSYCSDGTAAAIRSPHTYNGVTFYFVTSATPGQINRCNAIPVAITFTSPVRHVTLTFAGASVTYTMKIYDSGDNLIGTEQVDAILAAGTFEISFTSGSSDISKVTFGSETAITAIKEVYYEP